MAQIGMREVSFHLGGPILLDQVSFMIDEGERVCLTGRNGSGKTSLLRLLLGENKPDRGEIIQTAGIRLAYLPQDIPTDLTGNVAQIVSEGALHHEEEGSWKVELEAERWIAMAGLDPDRLFSTLSGGQKRRVLLARALASEPDLLLLDEPTNHLDIATIDWMEEILLASRKAMLFITHDRAFLRRLSTRILELDRGQLFDWACDWDRFLERKEAWLEAQEKEWSEFDKKVAQEEAWARRSPKARRARNEGRVRKLEEMRSERSKRREKQGSAQMRFSEGERSGDKVIETKNLAFAYGDKKVITSCTTTLHRGDKVALLGANGAGKTTLLRLLLGELQPTQGEIKLGSALQVLYLDQQRAQIDSEATVRDNIAGGQEWVMIGERRVHVMTYLQDFLFDPKRTQIKAGMLSGGERNRLLLAKLFTRPGNVLVLDEPTNDLDVEPLDLLEELLVDFEGTVLVVSHDREFLDHVATSTLSIDANGVVEEFVGGWSDWKRQDIARQESLQSKEKANGFSPNRFDTPIAPLIRTRKLSFKETKERESLPARIEALETEQAALIESMSSVEFYRQTPSEIASAKAKQETLENELTQAYARWEELEGV